MILRIDHKVKLYFELNVVINRLHRLLNIINLRCEPNELKEKTQTRLHKWRWKCGRMRKRLPAHVPNVNVIASNRSYDARSLHCFAISKDSENNWRKENKFVSKLIPFCRLPIDLFVSELTKKSPNRCPDLPLHFFCFFQGKNLICRLAVIVVVVVKILYNERSQLNKNFGNNTINKI